MELICIEIVYFLQLVLCFITVTQITTLYWNDSSRQPKPFPYVEIKKNVFYILNVLRYIKQQAPLQ